MEIYTVLSIYLILIGGNNITIIITVLILVDGDLYEKSVYPIKMILIYFAQMRFLSLLVFSIDLWLQQAVPSLPFSVYDSKICQ